jgi:hypothetical protein
MAGSSLVPRVTAPVLREGRAWGAAVAAWHATGSLTDATDALNAALDEDAARMRAAGAPDDGERDLIASKLDGVLQHYVSVTTRLQLDSPEHGFDVQVRTGWRLHGRFDGLHIDADGRVWIVEFKLRRRLTDLGMLALDRQGRRYAWAWREATGEQLAGVIFDETLNQVPQPPRVLASGATSHDVRQHTTADWYVASCADTGTTPSVRTVDALRARRWHQRHRVTFTAGELEDTGRELVSLTRLIGDLESGRITPFRAPSTRTCPGCPFRDVCNDPRDTGVVDALFTREPAKRDRQLRPAG